MNQRKVKAMDLVPEEKSNTSFQGKFVSKKIIPSKESNGEKKPFNKKLWRTKKYSKKYKLQQWEEKRKKVVMKEYYRQIKDEVPKFDVQKIYEQDEAENDNENNLNADIKERQEGEGSSKEDFKRKGEEDKFEARASYKEKQEERNKAKKEYQERRRELMKKINKRTKKGQLCLNDRIELLYSEIKGKMDEEKSGGKNK